jgi:hypothetical protein
VRSPAPTGLGDLTPLQGLWSSSPTRSVVDKSTCSRAACSLISDDSPVHCTITITLYLEARLPTWFLTHRTATTDGPARPGLTSEPTEDRACPAVQFASGPTARSAGGSASKPRATIGTEDRARETARKPGSPRSRGSSNGATGGSGEPSGENDEARQAARTGKLDRATDECPDLVSTATEAKRRPGAERRSERTNRPEQTASAPSRLHAVDSQQRRLAGDLEGRAHGVTGGNPLTCGCCAVLWRWSL